MNANDDERLLATLTELEEGQLKHRDACAALKKVSFLRILK